MMMQSKRLAFNSFDFNLHYLRIKSSFKSIGRVLYPNSVIVPQNRLIQMHVFFQDGESGLPSVLVASRVGLGRNHVTDFVAVGANILSRLRRGSVGYVFVDIIFLS